MALKPHEVDIKTIRWIIQVTKVKTEVRMMLSLFKSAKAIRLGEKDPLQWILEQVHESEMAEEWKETMTAQKHGLSEEEKMPTPNSVLQACGVYKEEK